MKQQRTVYIDGDFLPYRIGSVVQRTIYRLETEGRISGPFLTTRSKRLVNKYLKINPDFIVSEYFFIEEPVQVIETLKTYIQGIVQGSNCTNFKMCMSGETNFREEVATILPYKENRSGSEKPYYFDMIREWLLDKPYTIVSENEEADDVISKALMQGHVGSSPDKDLKNTPGDHYNFLTNKSYTITEDEASINFYRQMLTGDKTDNIPGIKGIGPVKAAQIVKEEDSPMERELAVWRVYREHYDKEIEAMTEVGQLLWMRREDNEMWKPRWV